MARGRGELPPGCRTYSLPLYFAAWVPIGKISRPSFEKPPGEDEGEPSGGGGGGAGDPSELVAILGGGGGEGRSGVLNAIIVSRFDVASRSLSEEPMFRLGTGSDLPYRMAVHPGGDGVLCSFENSSWKGCRWFEWNFQEDNEASKLTLRSAEPALSQLEGVGLQLALTFNTEGSMLATGGEDGHVRFYKWPSLEIILDQANAHATVKYLAFSLDGKYLASLGNSGPCMVWDMSSSIVAASLPREDGELFGICKFSQTSDGDLVLYITAMHGGKGTIISWNTQSWKRIGRKGIIRDSITAFNVSSDGRILAVGTDDGGVVLVSSAGMKVLQHIRGCHRGIVTALEFSQDSRVLISSSIGSIAHVAILGGGESKRSWPSLWLLALFVVVSSLLVPAANLSGSAWQLHSIGGLYGLGFLWLILLLVILVRLCRCSASSSPAS